MDNGRFSKLDKERSICRVRTRCQDRCRRTSRRKRRPYVREKLLLNFGSYWITTRLLGLNGTRVIWIIDQGVIPVIKIRIAIVIPVLVIVSVEVVPTIRTPRPVFARRRAFIVRSIEEGVA